MELSQLRYFMTAAECEHITKASQELYVSQSALSRMIGRLEGELGVKLFDRSGKYVYLNDAGKLALKYCKGIFGQLDEMELALKDLSAGAIGTVRIGFAVSSSAPQWLDSALLDYGGSHPGVELNLFQMDFNGLNAALMDRELDIGLTSHISVPASPDLFSSSPSIEWLPLFNEKIGIILSVDHPLAEQPAIYLRELENQRFLLGNSNSDMLHLTKMLFERSSISSSNVICQIDRPDVIGEMLALGMGVSFIAYSGFARHDGAINPAVPHQYKLTYRPIADGDFTRVCCLGMLSNKYQSRAVLDFKDVIIKYTAPLSEK